VLKVYIKQGVESFLFNGADLMWKGVQSLSRQEFKMHETVEVYARNSLVQKHLDRIAGDQIDAEVEDEEEETKDDS
jgi:hypothetical protein